MTTAKSPLTSAILNLKLWEEIPKAIPLGPSLFSSHTLERVVSLSQWDFRGKLWKRRERYCGERLTFRPQFQRLPRQPHHRCGRSPAPGSQLHPPAPSFRCRTTLGDTTERRPRKRMTLTAPASRTSPKSPTPPLYPPHLCVPLHRRGRASCLLHVGPEPRPSPPLGFVGNVV